MRKKVIAFLTLLFAVLLLFVSCPSEVDTSNAVGYVRFGDKERDFSASYDGIQYDTLYWFYTAVKADGAGNTGTKTTETPVITPSSGVLKKGLSGTIGPFSAGQWTFNLTGYKTASINSDGTYACSDAVYQSPSSGTTVSVLASDVTPISVTVNAVGETGKIVFRDAFFSYGSGSSYAGTTPNIVIELQGNTATNKYVFTNVKDYSVETGTTVIGLEVNVNTDNSNRYDITCSEDSVEINADYYTAKVSAYIVENSNNISLYSKKFGFRVNGQQTTTISGDISYNGNTYTITYKMKSGEKLDGVFYNSTTEVSGGTYFRSTDSSQNTAIALKTPTKSDATFVGWKISGGTSMMTEIPATMGQNLTLEAVWQGDGSTISLGTYNKQSVEWIIISNDTENKRVLLLSKYALEGIALNSTSGSSSTYRWYNSNGYKTLNGETFLKRYGMLDVQKTKMVSVVHDTEKVSSSQPKETTYEKVFLLSDTEFEKYVSGKSYAKAYNLNSTGTEVEWWLRTPREWTGVGDRGTNRASSVTYGGVIGTGNYSAALNDRYARPAFWYFYGEGNVTTYSITYNTNSGTLKSGATYPPVYNHYDTETNLNEDIEIDNPSYSGYVFAGWAYTITKGDVTTSGVLEPSGDKCTIPATWEGDIALTAIWKKTYTITYSLGDGTVSEANPTSYDRYTDTSKNSAVKITSPTKDLCIFTGWKVTGGSVTLTQNDDGSWSIPADANANLTLTAQWKENSIELGTLPNNGGAITWKILKNDTTNKRMLLLSEKILTTMAHYDSGVCTATGTQYNWSASKINSYLNDTSTSGFISQYGLSSVPIASVAHDTTIRDYSSGSLVTSNKATTYEKVFLLSKADDTSYTSSLSNWIAYDLNGKATAWYLRDPNGNTTTQQVYMYNLYGTETGVDPATVSGVRPAFWYYYGDCTLKTYTVTYDLDGGSLANGVSNPTSYDRYFDKNSLSSDTNLNTAITLSNPTRSDYTFVGWKVGSSDTVLTPTDGKCTISSTTTGNLTLKAIWSKTYNISYTDEGTLSSKPTSYTRYTTEAGSYTNNAVTISAPSKSGSEFAGWWDGTSLTTGSYTISKDVLKDISLTAVWKTTYKISYTMSDGTQTGTYPESYVRYSLVTTSTPNNTVTISAPTRTNYKFTGWTVNGAKNSETGDYTIASSTTGAINMVANWEEVVNEYKITYEFDSNTTSNAAKCDQNNSPTTYKRYPVTTANNTVVKITAKATDTGKIFAGWKLKGAADSTATLTYNISSSTTGDITLVAVWKNVNDSNLVGSTINAGVVPSSYTGYTYGDAGTKNAEAIKNAKGKDISWRILAVDTTNKRVLLLSDKLIAYMSHGTGFSASNPYRWANSTINKYLNESFLTEYDLDRVNMVGVEHSTGVLDGQGNTTSTTTSSEKVFLLSRYEVLTEYKTVFDNNKVSLFTSFLESSDNMWWFLRTTPYSADLCYAVVEKAEGNDTTTPNHGAKDAGGIRPAFLYQYE